MALVHADGFDRYGTGSTDLLRIGRTLSNVNWTAFASTSVQSLITATAGRFGGNAWGARNLALASGEVYSVTYPNLTARIRIGFWAKAQGSSSTVGGLRMGFTVSHSATENIATAATPFTLSGNGDVFLGASVVTIVGMADWHWFELEHNSGTNTLTLYIDSLLVSSSTIVRPADRIILGCAGTQTTSVLVDDIVWWDNSGTGLTAFPIGPQRIGTLLPTGVGTSDDFIPTAASNWESLLGTGAFGGTGNSSTIPTDLDYVQTSDLLWSPFSTSGIIGYCSLTNTGKPGTNLKIRASLGGTEYISSTIVLPVFQSEIHAIPFNSGITVGVLPSIADMNNGQVGYEIV